MTRQSGTTTQQLKEAPRNSIFIWCVDGNTSYARHLAAFLGRRDIHIMSPSEMEYRANGYERDHIIIDHAARLTQRQKDFLQSRKRK